MVGANLQPKLVSCTLVLILCLLLFLRFCLYLPFYSYFMLMLSHLLMSLCCNFLIFLRFCYDSMFFSTFMFLWSYVLILLFPSFLLLLRNQSLFHSRGSSLAHSEVRVFGYQRKGIRKQEEERISGNNTMAMTISSFLWCLATSMT